MADLYAALPAACDAVVIGGGASGTSIAYQLARRGVDVLLLEAGDIAQGATGRNGGLLDSAIDPASPVVEFYYASAAAWPGLAAELPLDVEYVQAGCLQVVLESDKDAAEVDAEFEQHQALGYPVRRLSREETLAVSPLFPETTSHGWLRPEDGQVNPILLAHALAEGAVLAGGRVRQNTPATGLRLDGERVAAVATPDGEVLCDQVVIALEPWSRPFLATLGLDVKVLPQRGQIFVTEPLPPLLAPAMIYGTDPYIYWRQTRHGSFTIGGCRPLDTHGDWLLEGPSAATTLDIQRLIVGIALRVHPDLARVNIVRWWGGVMGFTPDFLPVLGRSSHYENLVCAFGFCPNGILCAPMTGRVIADVVTGREPEVALDAFSPGRFDA
jgi:glycine/D-amino acid oxidase-like deaminating enzyme